MTGNSAPARSLALGGPRSLGVSVQRCPSVPWVCWLALEQSAGKGNPCAVPPGQAVPNRPSTRLGLARREAHVGRPEGGEAHG